MTPARRNALYGAVIGAALGLLSSTLRDQSAGGLYIPRTETEVIGNHIGYAVPWATIGGLIGYAVGRRRNPGDPAPPAQVAAAPLVETTALQRTGHVLGWTGTVVAVPLVAIGLYGLAQPTGEVFVKWAAIGLGIIAFLIGRALRYIFAGSAR